MADWRKAAFTHEEDSEAGHLYYFAPAERSPSPYKMQRRIEAIVDIADDGSFAGVELIDRMPPLRPVPDKEK